MAIENILSNAVSSSQSFLISVSIVLLISYVLKRLLGGYKNLPPGPWGLPIVGYIPFMEENVHEFTVEYAKKYGKIFSLKLGSKYGIFITDYEILKEVYSRSEFLDKPVPGPWNMVPDSFGFGLKNGAVWEEQRKHSLQMMRNAGMGKSYFEEQMHEEIRLALNYLEKKNGKPSNVKDDMLDSLFNISWILLFGHRMGTGDSRMHTLFDMMIKMMKLSSSYMNVYWYPWLRFLIQFWKPKLYRETMEHYALYEKIVDEEIKKKEKTVNENTPEDFTDFFLTEMKVQANNPMTSFSKEMLRGNILLYFLAGTMTTQVSILWLLFTMAKYPVAQQKIYEEIKAVTGNTREVCADDRKSMPYTMAVIFELQRWKTLVPISDYRSAKNDTKFRGYDIPKGSILFLSLWSAHNDKKLWKEPEKFKPERFLSEDGKSTVKPPGYLAFSHGRRNCPGEQVGYMQIFLFLTWILQKFQVKPEPGKDVDVDTEDFVFVVVPVDQNICFIKRD